VRKNSVDSQSELHQSPDGYSRAEADYQPYILRRLKTDKSVISDLPEKIEMKTYAPLSKKQLLLYKEMVRELRETIERTERHAAQGFDPFVAHEIQNSSATTPTSTLGPADTTKKKAAILAA